MQRGIREIQSTSSAVVWYRTWTTACLLVAVFSLYAAADVPRPEHPNPQMVRTEWQSLNGVWEFAEAGDEPQDDKFLGAEPYPDRITVPFCRESSLSGIGRRAFVKNVWYRRVFTVPPTWTSPRIRLHVGACDWKARVWVNGQLVGSHTGGNTPFAFDITEAVKRNADNTVVIHAFDDTAGGLQSLGKQSIRGESYSIFYTPTTGIWQSVWLEGVGDTFIRKVHIDALPDQKQVKFTAELVSSRPGQELEAEITAGPARVTAVKQKVNGDTVVLLATLPEVRLWSPNSPFLYDAVLTVRSGDRVIDTLKTYFGVRSISVQGAAILINGQPIFQRLILDQGFYPDGIWTAPSDAELRADIERSMACGFNGARLHQKVFEPRFLYWADKLGYLVWGEYPSFGARYSDPAVDMPILQEWVEVLERDRNHPSIIGWCPFNETEPAAARLQPAVVALTRALDPSRPVIESSGWVHTLPDPQVLDAHDYEQDPARFRAKWTDHFLWKTGLTLPSRYEVAFPPAVPFFVSEYGGIGWDIEKGWGYGSTPGSIEEWFTRFEGLTQALLDNRRLFGFCYTQLTNVEQEQNGLYTYDRKPKFVPARIKAIVSRPAAYESDPPIEINHVNAKWSVLIGSRHEGTNAKPWRYTTQTPPETWNRVEFNDESWDKAPAPFGFKGGDWKAKVRTVWQTADLWLRQSFDYGGENFDYAVLLVHHDDDIEVFLNGEPLWQHPRWTDNYEPFDVTEAARKLLRAGTNTLSVHVHQDRGGQYFDLAFLLAAKENS